MSLTGGQQLQADAAVAEVRGAFARARPRVYAAAAAAAVSIFTFDNAAQSVKKQLDDQAVRMERWAVTELKMVSDGLLSFTTWLSFGDTYARFAAGTVKDAYNTTVFAVVKDAATATASQAGTVAATVANPSVWPPWVKPALVVGGVVVALAVLAPYARAAGVAQ